MEQVLIDLVQDYQDLNPSYVEEWPEAKVDAARADDAASVGQSPSSSDAVPMALDFSRFVKRNRPVVFRGLGFQLGIPALHKWTAQYLEEKLGEQEVKIAATPEGNADALVDGVFVEPAYLSMTMHDFLKRLQDRSDPNDPVLYLQSQNDNLHAELEALLVDATSDLPFATQAFGERPEVANVWIGDERSVTSLHKDPYENLYLVVHGTKTFHLLPPTEFYCLHEQLYPTGAYNLTDSGYWTIAREDSNSQIPWIPIDPAKPVDLERYPRYKHAKPMSVTVHKGDVLYLPALWFHRVSQTASTDPQAPLAVAINWWYDLAYDSPTWTLANLVRRMTLALDGRQDAV